MVLVIDANATFGDLVFLGAEEKFPYENGQKGKEPDRYNVSLGSSVLEGPVNVTVPITVDVTGFKFTEKVALVNVVADPYCRTSEGSGFGDVVLRMQADNLIPLNRMDKKPQ